MRTVFSLLATGLVSFAMPQLASAQEDAPLFTGTPTCQSSSCHGGGTGRDQALIWGRKDIHHRALGVLSVTRSLRIGEALGIPDPSNSQRCLVCHSPEVTVPLERFAAKSAPENNVACETCHGAAGNWLRFHTRLDISHAQRVSAGLRDLKDAYHRSNVCIACHLNIDPAMIAAGHPEMFFELDGQIAAQPPHWKDTGPWRGPTNWLTGQAVSLRELSAQITAAHDLEAIARWRALLWLLRQTPLGAKHLTGPDDGFTAMQPAADALARAASAETWTQASTSQQLMTLAKLQEQFRSSTEKPNDLRRRAEVLLLALDRLWQALKLNGASSPTLDNAITTVVQESRTQTAFDQNHFAAALQQIEVALARGPAQ